MEVRKIDKEEAWAIRQIVMWPNKPLDFVKLKDDNIGVHYGVYDQHELSSVVSCFVVEKDMQFRKLATLVKKQQKGFGTHLLNYILSLARTKNLKKVWCNARFNKKAFYEKFGFREVGERFENDGIDFIIMELQL